VIRVHPATATQDKSVGGRVDPLLVLAASLFAAGGVHLAVAFDHTGSAFGMLAFAAGSLQLGLGIAAFARPSRRLFAGAVVLSLVLAQLYVLNVTVGLPPLIAHAHQSGTHSVLGVTVSLPNRIDGQGIAALAAEAIAVISAVVADRRSR
jgi:hypothetical protein